MKLRKIIPILFILLSLFSFVGCTNSKENTDEVLKYSTPIVENVLESVNSLDYDSLKDKLSKEMLEMMKDKESFISLMMPIKGKIGDYEAGSLKFVESMKKKDYISMLYEANFSSEKEPVMISVTFKDDDKEHKIQELYINSPKIQELAKNNKDALK
ncbi:MULTISPECIES: hypothetical protein [Clostridium]|uniref:hypothetical protein n=1 Tax=Clostridium TaxID=1485 RepID=UPI0021537852|nr:hypothetical protein [Clostridium sp. LY3-2]MCR6514862.1 hypothetical protein [Clostridium sp. LY3-2]